MKKILFLAIILIVFMLECVHTATNTAQRTDTLTDVNGSEYTYTIVNVDGDNYIQLADLATILSGKANGFSFSVSGSTYSVEKNAAYSGEKGQAIDEGVERPFYSSTTAALSVNGGAAQIIAAADIDGIGFLKIDDIIKAINIAYEWDEDNSTYCFLDNNKQAEAYVITLSTAAARNVIKEKENESQIDPTKPMIALTFDDGPKIGNTERIVEALQKTNSRATFFVVGEMVEKHPELVKLAYDAGCQIGNHTYAHLNLVKLSADEVKTQVFKTSNLVYDITGEYTMVGRPPYGSINDTVRNCISIPWYNWSIDTLDWKNRDASYVKNYVLENAKDGAVILMHDLHSTTADAMVTCIPELVNKGYQLVTMDELVKYKYGGDVTKVPGYVK